MRWTLPLIVLLALVGASISIALASFHLSDGKNRWNIIELTCGKTGGGCNDVLTSSWAALPGGTPVAALGFVYFAGLGLWYSVVGRANRRGRFWQGVALAAQIVGVLISLFLLGVMLTRVHALCWWCTLAHLTNLALLYLAWKLWPRDQGAIAPRPAPRLGAAGVLIVAALAALTFQKLSLMRMETLAESSNRYTQSLRQDIDLQRYLHLRQSSRSIPLRPDDAVRGNLEARHTVVVFGDFQCPACRQFALFSERSLLPRFGDRLRLVYRHFPLDPKCNPWQDEAIHHHACEAAFAAEAARNLGGATAFWRMHDLLFAHQATFATEPWAALGRQAGLDGAALAAQVARQTPRQRILDDAAAGHDVQLEYTPTVFLDGRPVADWSLVGLWQALLEKP